MQDVFKLAVGTVTGRDHLAAGRNNQDGFASWQSPACTIAIVTDGCSSEPFSEVGARLGARMLCDYLRFSLTDIAAAEFEMKYPANLILKALDRMLRTIYGASNADFFSSTDADTKKFIWEHFLFTFVGVIVTPQVSCVFSQGDGVYAVNGKIHKLGPFPNNAPPYIGYEALKIREVGKNCVPEILNTPEIESILIGTDGLDYLIQAESKKIPGKDELVGPLSQFWTEDRYFSNPDNVRRRLTLINREYMQPDWENRALLKEYGYLKDDTTLAVIRRQKQGGD